MKYYIVTLESKDKEVTEYRIDSETDDGAVEEAFQIISEMGYNREDYTLKQLYRIA